MGGYAGGGAGSSGGRDGGVRVTLAGGCRGGGMLLQGESAAFGRGHADVPQARAKVRGMMFQPTVGTVTPYSTAHSSYQARVFDFVGSPYCAGKVRCHPLQSSDVGEDKHWFSQTLLP